jgi:hypothetical protein
MAFYNPPSSPPSELRPDYQLDAYGMPVDVSQYGQTGSTGFPTNPPPTSPLVDMRGGEGNDMLYGPQGPYTSEGTPLIVGGANQVTSPLASMSSVQKPQGMIQGQAMSPDIQANFPTANTTYDPTKTIGDQIKALTSLADRQALLNNYGDYQTNQNIQGLYGLNKANADTFLKYANADKTGKTTNAFEQALMANPKGANALLSEFAGTGSNPLLGQYNVLPGGSILPYQNGVMTSGMAGTPATTNTTGTPASTTTASGTSTGITNTTLQNFINSNPNLTANDIKNLGTVLNSASPENTTNWLKQMTALGPNMFSLIANSAASAIAPTAEDLKVIASRGGSSSVPVYRPASQSTNAVGDVFTTKNSGILDQYKDASGYVHITSGGNQYLINPNSNRIISSTPITHDDNLSPYGQGPNPYQGPSV